MACAAAPVTRHAVALPLILMLPCLAVAPAHAISSRTLFPLTGATAGDDLGASVGTAGDVNRDGYDDVIVGAYGNDAGGGNAGRAYVCYRGPGADAVADLTLRGAAVGDRLGNSVGTAGDVNGDGLADLIIGAAFNDAGGGDAGRAYLYDCNRSFVLSPNDYGLWNVGTAAAISWLGAERADLWLSINAGRTYTLPRQDVGGSASNALNLLVPNVPTTFARIKVTPADAAIRGQDESDSAFTVQSSLGAVNATTQAPGNRVAAMVHYANNNSRAVTANGNFYGAYADGSSWQFVGNVFGGPTPAAQPTWARSRAAIGKAQPRRRRTSRAHQFDQAAPLRPGRNLGGQHACDGITLF